MQKMYSVDLKLIVAYWCHYVAPESDDRFSWSFEKVDIDGTRAIGQPARVLLQALALGVLDEHMGAYLAAGALEEYINLIVREKAVDEAAYIAENPLLNQLLPYAWGEVAQLMPLARRGTVVAAIPKIDVGLQAVDMSDIVGFWCKVSASRVLDAYGPYYERVLGRLFDGKIRPKVMHDLVLSAPDERAERYLRDEIFVLSGDDPTDAESGGVATRAGTMS